jgi:hypothetical protein
MILNSKTCPRNMREEVIETPTLRLFKNGVILTSSQVSAKKTPHRPICF